MAAAATATTTRRRKLIGQRRRVEDEGEDEGAVESQIDPLEDDSLTEGSIGSDEQDAGDDSDTSNVDDGSPTAANVRKPANGATKGGAVGKGRNRGQQQGQQQAATTSASMAQSKPVSDTDIMLHGLSINDSSDPVREMDFAEVSGAAESTKATAPTSAPIIHAAPIIVSSSSANRQLSEAPGDRRRREHEEYKRRRDEDPAFVPNRGAFFMHDHRHAGPAANGFRPFGRARGRGGRGGGFGGGLFSPTSQMHNMTDPTTSGPWAHDMHEAVAEPLPSRPPRPQQQQPHIPDDEGLPNGNGIIPTCPQNPTPINRTLSTEKHIGNVHVRVFIPDGNTFKDPKLFPGMAVKQYTKLPDHRPPLRRDKPVRISLPDHPPRYIFPAVDRSFIFIPRAMRPNQQQRIGRGKGRSGIAGSISGFSRRTSVFGGSYYGSAYSPSIALSRRSSLAPDGRDYMFSPTGSVVSRPPMPVDQPRPVVRLPPSVQMGPPDMLSPVDRPMPPVESSINDLPPPQTHPLPQKPTFPESRPSPLPMHQPRPQKAVSVADIESPTLSQHPQPYQQAFHQQVPVQVANGYAGPEHHTRQPSYPTQHSTGTPLSQIPERAIHAAPFQPNPYPQPNYYGHQPYHQAQMMAPQQMYYPAMTPSTAAAPTFVPGAQQGHHQTSSYPTPSYAPPVMSQPDQHQVPPPQQPGGPPPPGSNLVVQEANGMVYYYDAAQLSQAVQGPFPGYPPQSFVPGVPGVVGAGGMVTPSPDGFFYGQPTPGMVYYAQ